MKNKGLGWEEIWKIRENKVNKEGRGSVENERKSDWQYTWKRKEKKKWKIRRKMKEKYR